MKESSFKIKCLISLLLAIMLVSCSQKNLSSARSLRAQPTVTVEESTNTNTNTETTSSTETKKKTVLTTPIHDSVSISLTDINAQGGVIEGSINIVRAIDESDISSYKLYWGQDDLTKQSTTPVASIDATGANLTFTFPPNTQIPTTPPATHLLLYAANDFGESPTGISLLIIDLGVPTHAAASITFADTDLDVGELAGAINISKASSESDLTDYVLYWGRSATSKQSLTPITTIAATGSNLVYNLPANTVVPSNPAATHLLVFTKNSEGEMATPASIAISDKNRPSHGATSLAFTDSDTDADELGGTITIGKASSESDITHYVLYWGADASTKQDNTAIAILAKTGSNLNYTLSANTTIPSSPTATHILVYTKNADGEMLTGTSALILDKHVPVEPAQGVSFTDTDTDGGQISGTINITKASSEADITAYSIYWGSDASTKQSGTAITTLAKTGSDLTYSLAVNTAVPSSPTATHLLVFTKNADGEMATGVAVAITDKAIPTDAAASVAFTDTDLSSGEIAGTVTITKAASETNITDYVLYWGSSATTKQNATPITTIAKTGSNVTYTFSADSAIPTTPTATHLLVFTKNADGEMASGVSVAITDKVAPTNAAASVSFTDTDLDNAQIAGTVSITKAATETDITHYVLYWGSNATTKQNATPLTTLAKTGSNLTYAISSNTAIPTSPTATHLLVFTKNADGEMATGVSVAITDVSIPVHQAAGLAFTDTDTDSGEVGGDVVITKATTETDVTQYVLYWGSDASTKQDETPITTINKTGANITYALSANTAIPSSPTATHLLVYTKNADGEMSTGVSVALVDSAGPAWTSPVVIDDGVDPDDTYNPVNSQRPDMVYDKAESALRISWKASGAGEAVMKRKVLSDCTNLSSTSAYATVNDDALDGTPVIGVAGNKAVYATLRSSNLNSLNYSSATPLDGNYPAALAASKNPDRTDWVLASANTGGFSFRRCSGTSCSEDGSDINSYLKVVADMSDNGTALVASSGVFSNRGGEGVVVYKNSSGTWSAIYDNTTTNPGGINDVSLAINWDHATETNATLAYATMTGVVAAIYSSASGTWTSNTALNSGGTVFSAVSAAYGNAGSFVVWVEDTSIKVSANTSGTWSAATTLSSGATSVGMPLVKTWGASKAVAIWQETRAGRKRIVTSNFNGSSWSTATAISSASVDAKNPNIWPVSSTRVIASWYEQTTAGGSYNNIMCSSQD